MKIDFEVDFGSNENANIAGSALAVDKELQPDKVKRKISICDGKLKVQFEAVEARFLRASFSSFLDLLILTTQLIEEYATLQSNVILLEKEDHLASIPWESSYICIVILHNNRILRLPVA
ncbi:uncharacterized protein LOC122004970 [Zingiber officinale]|uniref:uncharacterized protein LOC122004970 n=1 Tax=Zingiber officinale TaxID=94328 RepID=UPI001C4D7658|nr:uncharacterized protein LOC122004970 [Zingiber officinale]